MSVTAAGIASANAVDFFRMRLDNVAEPRAPANASLGVKTDADSAN
jgi:hypothetical protein